MVKSKTGFKFRFMVEDKTYVEQVKYNYRTMFWFDESIQSMEGLNLQKTLPTLLPWFEDETAQYSWKSLICEKSVPVLSVFII